MTRIVAIDPGLDGVGLSIFDVDLFEATGFARLHDALINVRTIRTSADDDLVTRLKEIGGAVRHAALESPIWRVYVEEPAKPGSYMRNRATGAEKMAAPMSKLYLAVGAIIDAGLSVGAEVIVVPAPRIPKDQRHQLAAMIFPHSPAVLTHRNALPSADALDAIWLGAQQMSGDITFDRRRAARRV